MIRRILAGAALLALTTLAVAQTDPIATRRNIMKGVGAATKVGSDMAKGERPFDLAKAQEVLQTYAVAAEGFHKNFPDTSKTGGETTASPKIWESQEDFRQRFETWSTDIKKASAETKDLDSFKASFGTVAKACGSCHQTYRIKA